MFVLFSRRYEVGVMAVDDLCVCRPCVCAVVGGGKEDYVSGERKVVQLFASWLC